MKNMVNENFNLNLTSQFAPVGSLYGMYSIIDELNIENFPVSPIVVFMAFSAEAYINDIGFRKIPHWESLEKNSWFSKIIILHVIAKREPNWAENPLQFCKILFTIRDKLAHGKPEKIKWEQVGGDLPVAQLEAEWQKGLNMKWAKDGKIKFRNLMIYLGSLYDLPESDHLNVFRLA
jgi:hypothetical protein